MGNTDLKPQIIHSNQWVNVKQLNHPLYGPIKIFKNSQEKFQCLRTFTVQEDEKIKLFTTFKQLQEEENLNFVKINQIELEEESQLCTTYHKIHITMDYTEKQLENIYQVNPQQFCLNILQTLKYLDSQKLDTCQFCLSKLLVFGDQVKLVYQEQLTQQSDYSRLINGDLRQEDWFTAPEVMKCIRMNDQKTFNNQKATVFNFGLIIIALYTGCTPKTADIYNYEKCCLTENFDKYIRQFNELNLNQNFQKIIQSCLSFIPDKRPTYDQLIEKLNDSKLFYQEDLSPQKVDSRYTVPTNQLVSFNPTVMDERVLSDTTNLILNDDQNKLLLKKIDLEKHQNTPICQSPKFRQETLVSQTTVGNLRSTKLYNLDNLNKQTNKRNSNKSQNKKQRKF